MTEDKETAGEAALSITVLVPTHGRPVLLKQTLKAVAACSLPDGYRELIVIENGSCAGAEKIVESLPSRLHARYMHDSWGNKSNALNKAIETIDSGLVVFFDDDVEMHPDTLVSYSTTAREHGPGHFYGGDVRVDREGSFPDGFASKFPASTTGYDAADRVGRDGMVFLGFNWAVYKEDLDRMGGFNPLLGPGSPIGTSVGDESELQQRMMEEGIEPVAVPQAVVTHDVPEGHTTFRWLLKRKYRVGLFEGLTEKKGEWSWAENIRVLIKLLGLLLKGVSTLQPYKVRFSTLHIASVLGKMKGVFGQKK
ncbi:glycosyltransferase [Salinibacter ruber]|uniref:glycosyltransferase n=1 Tax=Salinibacter ruber TaxID=146919 RepID=UPI002167BCDF|nr:glycosyltransferase [Salinibacter ruber]MCS4185027.1 cellulose synthase/poly-beta-1,6-N-acetylglucosamine synthase-like glycosyltransferase [Salinibacter ruber]